jgi:hypothetical protein
LRPLFLTKMKDPHPSFWKNNVILILYDSNMSNLISK